MFKSGYPTLNEDLLDKVMDHIETIEAFRKEGVIQDAMWTQGTWRASGGTAREHLTVDHGRQEGLNRCNSSFCFAGWAIQLGPDDWASDYPHTHAFFQVETETGERYTASAYARNQLGLTSIEAEDLFHASNNLDKLRDIVGHIKSGDYRV